MLTPGQAHDLACAEPLLEEADPETLIGDKAYDADPLLDTLAQREITPVIPPKANRKTPRTCDFASTVNAISSSASSTNSSTFELSPHATTNWPEISSPAFNWPALSFSSTEDRP
jgi:IS5 family transposase